MIRKHSSLTYASELLVDRADHEHRMWVRDGNEQFQTHLEERCVFSLRLSGIASDKTTVRQWLYARADEWMQNYDEGRAFAERVAQEMESHA